MNEHQPPGSDQAILRARARALARRPQEEGAAETIELLEFRLARECLAVETRHVREVLPLQQLAPVPCTPAFVAGVVNVRGTITAVIDIQRFLGLPSQGLTDLHHVILVRCQGLELGLLADTVTGVQAHPVADLQPPQATLARAQADHVKGITASRVVVLDVERMLADPRLIVHEEVNP